MDRVVLIGWITIAIILVVVALEWLAEGGTIDRDTLVAWVMIGLIVVAASNVLYGKKVDRRLVWLSLLSAGILGLICGVYLAKIPWGIPVGIVLGIVAMAYTAFAGWLTRRQRPW